MAIPDTIQDKKALRGYMRGLVRTTPPTSDPCGEVLEWLAGKPALKTIATYSALPGEVDLALAVLARPDLRWVYPKVNGHHLSFHEAGNMVSGSFGIMEPREDSPEIPIDEIDAFLCPGLAFDRQGGRLGRGKGFYDRMLERVGKHVPKAGVCHEFQLVENTFPEAHDIRMDVVLHG